MTIRRAEKPLMAAVVVDVEPSAEDLVRRKVEIRVEMSQSELERLLGRAQGTVTTAEWDAEAMGMGRAWTPKRRPT